MLVRELDGLTAILESHFGYEERRLGQALDALDPGTSIPDVFTLAQRPGWLTPRPARTYLLTTAIQLPSGSAT